MSSGLSDDVRAQFLRFFEDRGHRRVASAGLVPIDDPTLLFTSAGMVPFKPYFMGRAVPPAPRLTTAQRCFRTTDIDSVGDISHNTFFEMLGNFSIGDYFKSDAIPWAWELVTRGFGLPKERLWNTVYTDDDEAFDLWVKQGQRPERVLRYSEADGNYWLSGDIGPCGPCSEIFYDFGEELGCGPDCEPKHDCPRFLEIWNLVFMAFYQEAPGKRTPLPKKNVDTGAGLERITRVLAAVPSSYDTDVFQPILSTIGGVTGAEYGRDDDTTRLMRIIADHTRAVTFLIADGVLPANEKQGYVVRRLIRRMMYSGRLLGHEGPFLGTIADAVIDRLGDVYPIARQQQENIRAALLAEERRFGATLEAGTERLEALIADLSGKGDALPGEEVFRLYGTYGIPLELTEEIAARHGLRIDREGFEHELEAERQRSQAEGKFRDEVVSEARVRLAGAGRGGRFVGYETLRTETSIEGILAGSELLERAHAGRQVQVVLHETPFYPEGGGQVGDAGEIRTESGTVRVEDTRRDEGLILHSGVVVDGTIALEQRAEAIVDTARRQNTTLNHSGTHLLHASLRAVLGSHVRQMGSLVAPERLRFDYQQPEAPTAEQRLAVERLVNEKIRQDIPITTRVMNREAALGEGVLAFFGDKYGDEVRVVEMNDGSHRFSAELCGGTHVHETGEIGMLLLVGDASIGAGIRRVEALTGSHAERYVEHQIHRLERIAQTLGTQPEGIEARLESLMADLDRARKQQAETQRQSGRQTADELAGAAERVGDVGVVAARVDGIGIDGMREIGDGIRQKLHRAAIVLGSAGDGRVQCVVMVSPELAPPLDAREILNQGLATAGVRGGGRPQLAQGGGTNPAALDQALAAARQFIKERLSG